MPQGRRSSDPIGRIALVIPCFNEAQRLPVDRVKAFLGSSPGVDLLFVDDGSTDATLALLEDLATRLPGRTQVLTLAHNGGKAEAVRQGLLQVAEQPYRGVGFWDADLATPLEAVHDFVAVLHAHPTIDWVIGARVKLLGRTIERRETRHYFGRVFATAASLMLGLPVYDTQTGAKLFRNNTELREVLARPFGSRWIFDVEMIQRFQAALGSGRLAAGRIYELPLTEWRDVDGSKVRPTDFVHAIAELASLWWRRA